MILLNPHSPDRFYPDERSRQIMLRTIAFFEHKGKCRIKEDDHNRTWYSDFLDYQKQDRVFATLLTPSAYGFDEDCRWDTWRNCEFNEILGFYGLAYWYTWQVTNLGLGPVWMSENEPLKQRAASMLYDGHVFAFGLSERAHGADIYATEMSLTPQSDGTFLANGEKYYIGNANLAPLVSTFGKIRGTGEYVFFAADYRRAGYQLRQNVTASQNYVGQYALQDYAVSEAEILSRGKHAWDAALNTVNICKFNLGWGSIGICTHAFYEAIRHAANRRLYGMYVTDFPHVRQMFVDAFARLIAMKLFALRAADYMRSASASDRRYLLFNPMVKMKVTTQGEEVIDLLWDVIAAKGFEKDTYFEMAARDIRALPKLEGTVHVNIALIVKFMANYFFNPTEYPAIPRRDDPADDVFFWNQGPTSGLSQIRFEDFRKAFQRYDLPNINLFREQAILLQEFLAKATPTDDQQKDVDYLLALGELFALVVYAQLILENASIYNLEVDEDLLEQVFDCLVRDFSSHALQLYSKPSSTPRQIELSLQMLRKPVRDPKRFSQVWEQVHRLKDAYELAW